MITIDVKVSRTVELQQNQSAVFQLLTALDPTIVKWCNPEPDNFSHLKLYHTVGLWGDVSNYKWMGDRGGYWERWLLSIQPSDNVYNKLINDTDKARRPYWYQDGQLVFGDCVPAGNKIRLKTNADGSLKITTIKGVDFAEIDGLKKGMEILPLADLIAGGYIGYWYSISPTWKVNRSLGGVANMLCPFLDDVDFPSNGGKSWLRVEYLASVASV